MGWFHSNNNLVFIHLPLTAPPHPLNFRLHDHPTSRLLDIQPHPAPNPAAGRIIAAWVVSSLFFLRACASLDLFRLYGLYGLYQLYGGCGSLRYNFSPAKNLQNLSKPTNSQVFPISRVFPHPPPFSGKTFTNGAGGSRGAPRSFHFIQDEPGEPDRFRRDPAILFNQLAVLAEDLLGGGDLWLAPAGFGQEPDPGRGGHYLYKDA